MIGYGRLEYASNSQAKNADSGARVFWAVVDPSLRALHYLYGASFWWISVSRILSAEKRLASQSELKIPSCFRRTHLLSIGQPGGANEAREVALKQLGFVLPLSKISSPRSLQWQSLPGLERCSPTDSSTDSKTTFQHTFCS
jgi:hypothetical protein